MRNLKVYGSGIFFKVTDHNDMRARQSRYDQAHVQREIALPTFCRRKARGKYRWFKLICVKNVRGL
jgi:hypothetical protein